MPDRGKKIYKYFIETRLNKKDFPFYTPIKRNVIKGFNCSTTKKKSQEKNSVNINRDILARLLYTSNSTGKKINSEKALNYPLSAVPLSLYNADGSVCKTSESEPAHIFIFKSFEENTDALKENLCMSLISVTLIRVVTAIPETSSELALKLPLILPKGYLQVGLISDWFF